MTFRKQIKSILEKDAKHRYETVEDDLITLDQYLKLSSLETRWRPNKVPAIYKEADAHLTPPKDTYSFQQRYYGNWPGIPQYQEDPDFWKNILIAGGSVCQTLLGINFLTDIDIFLYGLTPEEATIKAKSVIRTIKNRIMVPAEYFRKNIFTLGKNCLSYYAEMYLDGIPTGVIGSVQVILRTYHSISAILHGFDLGSSAVGFDGRQVYFTSLSQFSYRNMVNMVNPERRSPTYENRLIKYLGRGFAIVMPDFDPRKIKTKNLDLGVHEYCELPFMPFSYSEVTKKTMHHEAWLFNHRNNRTADYDTGMHSPIAIRRWNLHELIRSVAQNPDGPGAAILRSKQKIEPNFQITFAVD
jgi:hypothetical protein